MDYTRYNHLTHAELSQHIATLEQPSDLEVECMQRIDMLLELVHELEEAAGAEPEHKLAEPKVATLYVGEAA